MTGPAVALGARVEVSGSLRPDVALFGESASRIVLSVRPDDVERVQALARERNVPCTRLGEVGGESLAIVGQGFAITVPVSALRDAWANGLSRVLG